MNSHFVCMHNYRNDKVKVIVCQLSYFLLHKKTTRITTKAITAIPPTAPPIVSPEMASTWLDSSLVGDVSVQKNAY